METMIGFGDADSILVKPEDFIEYDEHAELKIETEDNWNGGNIKLEDFVEFIKDEPVENDEVSFTEDGHTFCNVIVEGSNMQCEDSEDRVGKFTIASEYEENPSVDERPIHNVYEGMSSTMKEDIVRTCKDSVKEELEDFKTKNGGSILSREIDEQQKYSYIEVKIEHEGDGSQKEEDVKFIFETVPFEREEYEHLSQYPIVENRRDHLDDAAGDRYTKVMCVTRVAEECSEIVVKPVHKAAYEADHDSQVKVEYDEEESSSHENGQQDLAEFSTEEPDEVPPGNFDVPTSINPEKKILECKDSLQTDVLGETLILDVDMQPKSNDTKDMVFNCENLVKVEFEECVPGDESVTDVDVRQIDRKICNIKRDSEQSDLGINNNGNETSSMNKNAKEANDGQSIVETGIDCWYQKQLLVEGPVKDSEILETAKQLALTLGIDFFPDGKWLGSFKMRQRNSTQARKGQSIVESAIECWYQKKLVVGPVKDYEILETANQLALMLRINFSPDLEWLESFKMRRRNEKEARQGQSILESGIECWYQKKLVNGPVKDNEILETANQLALTLGIDFFPDVKWLRSFKRRQVKNKLLCLDGRKWRVNLKRTITSFEGQLTGTKKVRAPVKSLRHSSENDGDNISNGVQIQSESEVALKEPNSALNMDKNETSSAAKSEANVQGIDNGVEWCHRKQLIQQGPIIDHENVEITSRVARTFDSKDVSPDLKRFERFEMRQGYNEQLPLGGGSNIDMSHLEWDSSTTSRKSLLSGRNVAKQFLSSSMINELIDQLVNAHGTSKEQGAEWLFKFLSKLMESAISESSSRKLSIYLVWLKASALAKSMGHAGFKLNYDFYVNMKTQLPDLFQLSIYPSITSVRSSTYFKGVVEWYDIEASKRSVSPVELEKKALEAVLSMNNKDCSLPKHFLRTFVGKYGLYCDLNGKRTLLMNSGGMFKYHFELAYESWYCGWPIDLDDVSVDGLNIDQTCWAVLKSYLAAVTEWFAEIPPNTRVFANALEGHAFELALVILDCNPVLSMDVWKAWRKKWIEKNITLLNRMQYMTSNLLQWFKACPVVQNQFPFRKATRADFKIKAEYFAKTGGIPIQPLDSWLKSWLKRCFENYSHEFPGVESLISHNNKMIEAGGSFDFCFQQWYNTVCEEFEDCSKNFSPRILKPMAKVKPQGGSRTRGVNHRGNYFALKGSGGHREETGPRIVGPAAHSINRMVNYTYLKQFEGCKKGSGPRIVGPAARSINHNVNNAALNEVGELRKGRKEMLNKFDTAIRDWYTMRRPTGAVTYVEVKEKAEEIAHSLGLTKFTASTVWMKRFFGIISRTFSGVRTAKHAEQFVNSRAEKLAATWLDSVMNELNEKIKEWYVMHSKTDAVTWNELREKAEEIALSLHIEGFRANVFWMNEFVKSLGGSSRGINRPDPYFYIPSSPVKEIPGKCAEMFTNPRLGKSAGRSGQGHFGKVCPVLPMIDDQAVTDRKKLLTVHPAVSGRKILLARESKSDPKAQLSANMVANSTSGHQVVHL